MTQKEREALKILEREVIAAPIPKLRTRYQKTSFALRLATLLQKHKDDDVQELAEMIVTLLGAPDPVVQGMLTVKLREHPKLKHLAMQVVA